MFGTRNDWCKKLNQKLGFPHTRKKGGEPREKLRCQEIEQKPIIGGYSTSEDALAGKRPPAEVKSPFQKT